MLGSIKKENNYVFKTYAPSAKKVELYIHGTTYDMINEEGIWGIQINVEDNTTYSYIIDGIRKCDPFANKIVEIVKGNPESVTYTSYYQFKNKRINKPVSKIYEVYLKKIPGHTYQEKAEYILNNAEGFSHIQIMPFNYTPNKKTLGYKTSTYFAPEPFYGELDDLKEMIDLLHGKNFGVILDFSIFEFEEFSNTGLKMYDGSTLFEYDNKIKHPIFTGFFFDISKPFVKDFLKKVVSFLLEDLQGDGIRIDGVNEIVFKNQSDSQKVNESGLLFIKEVIETIPEDRLIIADMLTHHTLEELGLKRINYVEGNIIMFQLQNILLRGIDWFNKVKDIEVKHLYKSLKLLKENHYISTINHDVYVNGIDNELINGKLKSQKHFDFLKKFMYALPIPKQLYFQFEIDQTFKTFIEGLKDGMFDFDIYDNNIIIFRYNIEENKENIVFDLNTLEVYLNK